jgi:hypothetical protein
LDYEEQKIWKLLKKLFYFEIKMAKILKPLARDNFSKTILKFPTLGVNVCFIFAVSGWNDSFTYRYNHLCVDTLSFTCTLYSNYKKSVIHNIQFVHHSIDIALYHLCHRLHLNFHHYTYNLKRFSINLN